METYGGTATIMTDTAVKTTSLTILFGSQTGNAEYLAHQIQEESTSDDFKVDVLSLEEWLHSSSRSLERLLVVTSTHDNGHMPDNAAPFWDWLNELEPGALEGLPYAVLSIGDSMYEDFCKAGHDIDQRLQELGAERAIESVDCDVDFEFSAAKWATRAIAALAATDSWETELAMQEPSPSNAPEPAQQDQRHSARVVGFRQLSIAGSTKNVVHYELAFDGPFEYQPGDSITVFPANSEELVDQWITAFDAEDAELDGPYAGRKVRDVLRNDVELRIPHLGLVMSLSRLRPENEAVQEAAQMIQSGERSELEDWLWGKDVLDILTQLNCLALPISDVIKELRPLQHRDYSIASSPIKDDGSLHLTVNAVEYSANERTHKGVATSFLAERGLTGEPFEVRRLPAHEFRLPPNDVPVIMIGPGVGVAPFRAFLRHRDACGATGRNWLFFGDRNSAFDWIYKEEFSELLDSGVLDRLDVAFSRDGSEKHYVQDRMLANADDILQWIDEGAHIFVCGDKTRMAADVDRSLLRILAGKFGEAGAQAELQELKSSARYVKDVY